MLPVPRPIPLAYPALPRTYPTPPLSNRYCLTVHPLKDTPCTHLVVGGVRYLIFPELDECCQCCTAAQGCGVLSPSWLQGAEYGGQVTLRGYEAHKWSVKVGCVGIMGGPFGGLCFIGGQTHPSM